jgi:amino acid transporter
MTAPNHVTPPQEFNTALSSTSPVDGLARRQLGFREIFAQSLAAAAPCGGVIVLPIMVYSIANNWTILSTILGAMLMLLVGHCINVYSRRISASGSLYTFVAKGIGPKTSLLTATAMICGYLFITMFELFTVSSYLSDALSASIPQTGRLTVKLLVFTAVAIAFTAIMQREIHMTSGIILVVEAVSLIALVTLCIVLFSNIDIKSAPMPGLAFSGESPLTSLSSGIAMAIIPFVGFESASALGSESKKPLANIPRALTWTLLITGGIQTFGAFAQLTALQALNLGFSARTVPLNSIASALNIPWIGALLSVTMTFSLFAGAVAASTALTRLLFTLSKEGTLPRYLSITSGTRKVPIFGVYTILPVVLIVPLVMLLSNATVFNALDILLLGAASGYIIGYGILCASAPLFLRKIGEESLWTTISGFACSLVLAASIVVFNAISLSNGGVGTVLFLVLFGALITVLGLRLHRIPHELRKTGLYDEPLASDVLGGARLALDIESFSHGQIR